MIRNAVAPPKPGSLDPLGELAVLMKRKDLTALEAQRAQMLMKDHGMIHKQGDSVKLVASIPLATCSLYPPLASEAITAYSGSEWATGASLLGADPPPAMMPHALAVGLQAKKFELEVDVTPRMSQSTFRDIQPLGQGSSCPTTRAVFMGSLATSYPEAQAAFCSLHVDERARMSDTRPTNPPPGVEVLSTVRDGDGHYEGYIAVNGTCVDVHGVCIGYLNDFERTAGSPKGEYLGCITEPCNGEAMIERPEGTQLAVLELGRTQLKTLSGSTVAEFKVNGEVIANLGHRVCSFDALSFHDQPTMALYLSFINPSLLTKAALIQSSAHQSSYPPCVNPATHGRTSYPGVSSASSPVWAFQITPSPCTSFTRPSSDVISDVISHDAPLSHSNECRCLVDFISSEPWQLSAKAGDALLVVETHDDGWATCLDVSGRRGMLPSAYFEGASPPMSAPTVPKQSTACIRGREQQGGSISTSQVKLRTRELSLSPDGMPEIPQNIRPVSRPILAPEPDSSSPIPGTLGSNLSLSTSKIAIAPFDADAAQAWQISMHFGEVCRLVEDHSDGWASIIKANGEKGIVPVDFLGPMMFPEQSLSQPSPRERGTHRALHHFVASDLSWQIEVETDDEVELHREFDDGWSSIVQLRSGRTGLVPSEFLAPKSAL